MRSLKVLSVLVYLALTSCGKGSKGDNTRSADSIVGDFFLTDNDFKSTSLAEMDSYDAEQAGRNDMFSSSALRSAGGDSGSPVDFNSSESESQACFMRALERGLLSSSDSATLKLSFSANLAPCFPPEESYKVDTLAINLFSVTHCPEADFSSLDGKTLRTVIEDNLLERFEFMSLCSTLSTAQHSTVTTLMTFKGDDGSQIALGQEVKSFNGGTNLNSLCDEQISGTRVTMSDDCTSRMHRRTTGVYQDGKKLETPLDSEIHLFRSTGLIADSEESSEYSPFIAGRMDGVVNEWNVAIEFNETGSPSIEVTTGTPQSQNLRGVQRAVADKSRFKHQDLESKILKLLPSTFSRHL